MTNTLYLPELREMLAGNKTAELREFSATLHPARTAEFMEGLTAQESWQVIEHAERPLRTEIFGFFDEQKQIEIVQTSDRTEIARFIGDLPPDDRVDLLNEVDPQIVEELMPLIPVEERRDIQRLSSFAEDTAGAVMTTEFARLSETWTVTQAFQEIAKQAEELETIYYLYVVDEEDHLRGLVSARELVSAMGKPNAVIGDMMSRDIVTVNVEDDQEEVAQKVARYNLLAIPVVDDEHHMLGIVTHDDVLDVMVEEAAEDAYRIAAVAPLDEGYLETSLVTLARKRAMWLILLLFGALVTAGTLSRYGTVTYTIPWLVFFLPLVISTGGNTGSQSATLVITALSTGNLTIKDWWRVVRRELVMGLLLGGFLGAIGYLFALWWAPSWLQAAVIPATLLLVVVCGTLIGSLLPLVFRSLGWDPALMSNPFVACLMDALGTSLYLTVAVVLLLR